MASSLSSDYEELREILKKAKHIVVLTGAGISAESGIPTFRGSDGLWRKYDISQLATPAAFQKSPSLVWEFHHFGRELVFSKQPNKAHEAIADLEESLKKVGRKLTVITQNVDGLHQRAGSSNVIELHGSLYKTQCLDCKSVEYNSDSPICEALQGRGQPDADANSTEIPLDQLPRCQKTNCKGLLRPFTVWFGEGLQPDVLQKTGDAMADCDVCLVVGTSSVVYPAAMFAPSLAIKGIPVAEFNMESTPATHNFRFHFSGSCTETIPKALQGVVSDKA